MEWGRPKACLKVFCRYVVRPGSSEYVCYDAVKISGRVLEGAKVRNAQPYTALSGVAGTATDRQSSFLFLVCLGTYTLSTVSFSWE